jgi:prepilin-type processing-associated H-X9-DG protein
MFRVDMAPGSNIMDKYAACHNGGGSLTFADGHAEAHRWSGFAANLIRMKQHATELTTL